MHTERTHSAAAHPYRPNLALLAAMAVLLVVFLGFVVQADQKEISSLADDTIDFLISVCQRYDDYAAGQDAADLNSVLNKTQGIARFASAELLADPEKLSQYISTIGLTGLLVTDADFVPAAQASVENRVPSALSEVLADPSRQDIVRYKNKTFAERLVSDGVSYDIAVVSRQDADGLVIGYRDSSPSSTDVYTVSLEKTLTGNNFHKNPRIVITDGTTILASTTVLGPTGQPTTVLPIQSLDGAECSYDGLIRLHYGRQWWYGKRQVFQRYYIYVFYPFTEVFTNMLPVVTTAIAIYALLCMLMMAARIRTENAHRRTEEVQIRTIRTLSKLFAGTTVLHLQEDTFENIDLAPWQTEVPVDQSGIMQAYQKLALQLMAPAYQQPYLDFFNVDTMEQRLAGKDSLSAVMQDGTGDWYSMYLLPMTRDSSGHLQDVLVTSRNITHYKKNEEEYQARLRKTANDAQIANEAKTLFLRRMSHDVRTPINGIRGMAKLARDNLNDPITAGECIDKIITSTDYLHELLEDVLRMSKLESGTVVFEEKPYELDKLIAEVTDFIRVQAEQTQLVLAVDTSGLAHTHVVGSPVHLRQVMQNILSNAVKFTPAGGSIHVTCRERGCTADTMQFEFVCADTGIGISPEYRTRVFEPFVQEDQSARSRYMGTGLGLPIAKEILDQRGGTITVSSQKGHGSTFTVTLPLRLDPACAAAAVQPDAPASIEGVRILLVEDNEINLAVAQSLLEERGAHITAARDGRQAVDAFAASEPGQFEVILMDIMMPVMDGYEATKAIRAMGRSDAKTVPIFAMTANAFVEDIEHCLAAGMNEHIAKPIDLEQMVRVIAKYCKRG